MPISEEGRAKQLEALKKARLAKLTKQGNQVIADNMPQVVLNQPETVSEPVQEPTVDAVEGCEFVSLDGREMTVCLADKCWVGKTFTVTTDDCKTVGEKSGRIPSLESVVEELKRQLRTGGFIVQVR